MYELQTLSNFVNNPLGKGTSVLPNRELMVNDLKRRKKIMEDQGKKFDVTVYKNDVTGIYYFHIIVPSETKRNNNYDVVIELSPPEKKGVFQKVGLDKYNARFFSNAPSFVFTYAHIMYNNDMGVKFLIKKYAREVIQKAPEVRNPTGVILYEKSIMFAALTLLEDSNYFSEGYLKGVVKKNADNAIFAKVRTDKKILEEIDKENKRLSIEKRENKKEQKDLQRERSKEVKRLAGVTSSTKRITASKTTSSSTKSVRNNGKNGARKTTRRK